MCIYYIKGTCQIHCSNLVVFGEMHVFSRWNTIFNVQCPSLSLRWLNPHLWYLVKKITTFAGSISMFGSSWVKASFWMIQFISTPSFLSFCFTATKATCAPALSRHGHGRVSRIYTWQKNTWLCWYLGLHRSYDVQTLCAGSGLIDSFTKVVETSWCPTLVRGDHSELINASKQQNTDWRPLGWKRENHFPLSLSHVIPGTYHLVCNIAIANSRL